MRRHDALCFSRGHDALCPPSDLAMVPNQSTSWMARQLTSPSEELKAAILRRLMVLGGLLPVEPGDPVHGQTLTPETQSRNVKVLAEYIIGRKVQVQHTGTVEHAVAVAARVDIEQKVLDSLSVDALRALDKVKAELEPHGSDDDSAGDPAPEGAGEPPSA